MRLKFLSWNWQMDGLMLWCGSEWKRGKQSQQWQLCVWKLNVWNNLTWDTHTHTQSELDATRPRHDRGGRSLSGRRQARMCRDGRDSQGWRDISLHAGNMAFYGPLLSFFSPVSSDSWDTETSAPTARTELTLRSSFLLLGGGKICVE